MDTATHPPVDIPAPADRVRHFCSMAAGAADSTRRSAETAEQALRLISNVAQSDPRPTDEAALREAAALIQQARDQAAAFNKMAQAAASDTVMAAHLAYPSNPITSPDKVAQALDHADQARESQAKADAACQAALDTLSRLNRN